MSHLVKMKVVVKDLDALAHAAQACGCELVRNQTTYKWFGHFVGDSPLPEGFTVDDLGKCTHAIRVKNPENPDCYEVGVVARPDGTYTLLYDYWQRGRGLENAIGEKANTLMQNYSTTVAMRQAQKQGFRVSKTVNNQGQVVLLCSK